MANGNGFLSNYDPPGGVKALAWLVNESLVPAINKVGIPALVIVVMLAQSAGWLSSPASNNTKILELLTASDQEQRKIQSEHARETVETRRALLRALRRQNALLLPICQAIAKTNEDRRDCKINEDNP